MVSKKLSGAKSRKVRGGGDDHAASAGGGGKKGKVTGGGGARRKPSHTTSERLRPLFHPDRPHIPLLMESETRRQAHRLLDPSDPETTERMLNTTLKGLGLYASKTVGDGNCMFRALSDQVWGNDNRHLALRQEVGGAPFSSSWSTGAYFGCHYRSRG